MALSVVVGGILNLLSLISRTTVLAYLGVGIVACAIDLLARRRSLFGSPSLSGVQSRGERRIFTAGLLLVVFMALFQYAGSVSRPGGVVRANFSIHDDYQGYFVYPEKMLQTGNMGRDPFNARRLESSLGGKTFLDTFVVSVLPEQYLHLLDPGISLLMVMGLLWGLFKEREISPLGCLGILLFFQLVPPRLMNITAVWTGLALFLSLYQILASKALPASRAFSRVFIIALVASAICSLKSNFIPACGVLLACSFFCYLVGQRFDRKAIIETVGTVVLLVAFTLPWMISMYQSSGTLLYPLLGKGYHASAYGHIPPPYERLTISKYAKVAWENLADASSLVFAGLGLLFLVTRDRKIHGREAGLSLLIGAAFGKVAITFATGGAYAYEYSFAFVFAAIYLLLIEILGRKEISSREETEGERWKLRSLAPLFAVGIAFFLVGSAWEDSRYMYLDYFRCIKRSIANVRIVSDEDVEEYEKVQQSVPAGEPILTRLDKPFLLNFKRNTVFAADWPGQASPPPGMPLSEGSEALARYLVSQSIRYVAYSYADEASYGRFYAYRLDPEFPVWKRESTRRTFVFQDYLKELGGTRRRIFDDGNIFVLDLLQPTAGEMAPDSTKGVAAKGTHKDQAARLRLGPARHVVRLAKNKNTTQSSQSCRGAEKKRGLSPLREVRLLISALEPSGIAA